MLHTTRYRGDTRTLRGWHLIFNGTHELFAGSDTAMREANEIDELLAADGIAHDDPLAGYTLDACPPACPYRG